MSKIAYFHAEWSRSNDGSKPGHVSRCGSFPAGWLPKQSAETLQKWGVRTALVDDNGRIIQELNATPDSPDLRDPKVRDRLRKRKKREAKKMR